MLKRILVEVVVALAVLAVLSVSIIGYLWLKEAPERAKSRKQAQELVAGLATQRKALEALGDVDFNTADLTLSRLREKLSEPNLRKSGSHDSTVLGWVCAAQSCTIMASFMTPFEQRIPGNSAPAVVVMMKPIVSLTHRLSIDGARLGSTAEDIEKNCKNRGYGAFLAKDKIACDDGWSLRWAGLNGQVDVLIFANEKLLGNPDSR